MACKTKKEKKPSLDELSVAILKSLTRKKKPVGTAEIAEKITEVVGDIDKKKISAKIKSLKTKGYLEAPERGKYLITDLGRTALRKR